MTNFELIAEAIKLIENNGKDAAIARLKQFVLLNTPKPKTSGKVKIYDWVYSDNIRPIMQGVYHDVENKVAVATDTRLLIVSKPDYVEQEDGQSKVILKNGDVQKGRFPDYRRVFPKDVVEFNIDRAKIADMLARMKSERKIDKSVNYVAFNVGNIDAPMYIGVKLCKAMLTLPAGKFYVSNSDGFNTRPLSYKSDDGNYEALFMPIYPDMKYVGYDMIPSNLYN